MLRHRSPARTFLFAATLSVVLAAGGFSNGDQASAEYCAPILKQ